MAQVDYFFIFLLYLSMHHIIYFILAKNKVTLVMVKIRN